MTDPELEQPIPEASDEKKPSEDQETIQDTKEQLASMYLSFLDKQKGGVLATGAGIGVNLNPLQKEAIEYLTTETKPEKKDIFSTIGKNIRKKFIEKMTGGTQLEYDKTSLNKMKALIVQYKDDQKKLQELMVQIEEGTDPTTIENTTNTPSSADVATGAAVVGTGAVVAEVYDKTKYTSPIENKKNVKITSKFGKRIDPVTGEKNKQHNGLDIAAPDKTPIHSIVSGKVIKNEEDNNGGGNYISIQGDDGKVYSYLHLHNLSDKKVGDRINAGDEIGKVGSTGKSTGPHLHISIKENDKPVDPLAVLPEVFDDYQNAA